MELLRNKKKATNAHEFSQMVFFRKCLFFFVFIGVDSLLIFE